MSIRRKIMLYVGMTTVFLVVLLYLISGRAMLRNYELMEYNDSQSSMKRILLSLMDEYKNLGGMTLNYSGSDDIYAFAARPTRPAEDDPYLTTNYSDSLYTSSRINFTVLLNKNKQVFFEKAYDYANNRQSPYPNTFVDSLLHEHAGFLEHPDASSRKLGLIILDRQPIIVASDPILTSDNEGPVHGTLVFARYLDSTFAKYLSEKADTMVSISMVNPPFSLPSSATTITVLGKQTFQFWTETNKETVTSFALLPDIENNPAAILQYTQPRELYKQAQNSLLFYLLYFCLSGFGFFIIVNYVLNRTIFSRLNRVINGIHEIETERDFSIRIPESGKDEFGKLEKSFNHMMTSLEQAQEEIQYQRSERMDIVSQLAASVAHEIRNPLQVTRGFLQLLLMKTNNKEKEYMQLAIDELDRAANIITDFLTFAKPQLEDVTIFDISTELKQIEGIILPLANFHGGEILHEISSELFIRGNSSKFKQAMINIIKNSIEAFKGNGRIFIKAYKNNDEVYVHIKDNGEGMDAALVKKLGEPYFSTKTKGTGLGLMVTFRIIKAMNGEIKFISEKGLGTEVIMRFPLATD